MNCDFFCRVWGCSVVLYQSGLFGDQLSFRFPHTLSYAHNPHKSKRTLMGNDFCKTLLSLSLYDLGKSRPNFQRRKHLITFPFCEKLKIQTLLQQNTHALPLSFGGQLRGGLAVRFSKSNFIKPLSCHSRLTAYTNFTLPTS